jgi:hypothetical protein
MAMVSEGEMRSRRSAMRFMAVRVSLPHLVRIRPAFS